MHFNTIDVRNAALAHIKEVLTWQPRGIKEMILSMAESMIELKMI